MGQFTTSSSKARIGGGYCATPVARLEGVTGGIEGMPLDGFRGVKGYKLRYEAKPRLEVDVGFLEFCAAV